MLRKSTGYIPTLDGWRAIAISAVILYHSSTVSVGELDFRNEQDLGLYGVSLFFAISGFLICGRLLDEEGTTGRISLKSFYLRRVFRIQPPALLYLLVLAVLGWIGVVRNPFWPWISALLCFRNFYTASVGVVSADLYTHHFWSLAVEEHFYLFLPLLLIVTKRWRGYVFGVLSVCSVFWVFLVRHFFLPLHPASGERTDLYAAALIFPAMLAFVIRREEIRVQIARWSPTVAVLSAVSFFASALWLESKCLWLIVICGFPFILLGTVLHPSALISKILESRPLKYIGRISYSLYLWQQIFVVNAREISQAGERLRLLQIFPLNLLCLLTLASGSYFLIERPIIGIGGKLVSRHNLASHPNGGAIAEILVQ
jgi:peptidoglycan/LPS O-acetylase OafA/YrhL